MTSEVGAGRASEVMELSDRELQRKRAAFYTKCARKNGRYDWPKLDCAAAQYGYTPRDFYAQSDGLMSYVGYRVGAKGQPRRVRWMLIDCVIHNVLPNVNSSDYMEQWGAPGSNERIAKLQSFLLFYSERQGHGDWRKAKTEYQEDLHYVDDRYITGF